MISVAFAGANAFCLSVCSSTLFVRQSRHRPLHSRTELFFGMTWILGSAPPFGYAALIADTRVTFGRKAHSDVLLKIHRVGSIMVAGFAGSVSLGFTMIEDMQRAFHGAPDEVWFPRVAAYRWHRRARRLFICAGTGERKLGCSILLAGVSAVSNGIPGQMRSYCLKMSAPGFEPELVSYRTWASIGNGAAHDLATKLADESFESFGDRVQTETFFPGAYASTLATSISSALARKPYVGVSEALVVGHAFGNGVKIEPTQIRVDIGDPTERAIGSGALARNRSEFERWCRSVGVSAARAAA
jgi:hypothetical protein